MKEEHRRFEECTSNFHLVQQKVVWTMRDRWGDAYPPFRKPNILTAELLTYSELLDTKWKNDLFNSVSSFPALGVRPGEESKCPYLSGSVLPVPQVASSRTRIRYWIYWILWHLPKKVISEVFQLFQISTICIQAPIFASQRWCSLQRHMFEVEKTYNSQNNLSNADLTINLGQTITFTHDFSP